MATLKVRCPRCGAKEVSDRGVVVTATAPGVDPHYHFRCPECDGFITVAIDEALLRALAVIGCQPILTT